jgi:hypothetical protein
MKKSALIWFAAIIITLSAAIYQRSTGPTYPKSFTVELEDDNYKFKLRRSHTITRDFYVELKDAPEGLSGKVVYKPYPTDFEWDEAVLNNKDGKLKAKLPVQPPAGKLAYYLILDYKDEEIIVAKENPVIIRFKGDVPAIYMIPHILIMFLAMLFSNITGLMVVFKHNKFKKYLWLSFICLLVGGMIFGPIIQKFAFGDYWTGWPVGKDLTDNKTLIGFGFFVIAIIVNIKKDRPWLALVAAIVLLMVYLIPHSLMGSEFDYSAGEVITG